MAFKPFEPKGEVARWVPIYNRLKDMDIGEEITYEELSELAGVNVRHDRSPFTRAEKELLEKNQRATTNVRDSGYRIAHPSENSALAKEKARKAGRQLTMAKTLLDNTDRNHLTPAQQRFNENMAAAIAGTQDMVRRISRRQDRQEEALKTVRRETKEATAELSERLARLEKRLLDVPESSDGSTASA